MYLCLVQYNFILKVKNSYRVSSRYHPAEHNEKRSVFYSCKQWFEISNLQGDITYKHAKYAA